MKSALFFDQEPLSICHVDGPEGRDLYRLFINKNADDDERLFFCKLGNVFYRTLTGCAKLSELAPQKENYT